MLKNEKSQEDKLATETRSPLASGDRVSVAQSIFTTIAYYDYFNYPLTAGEIYYYLIKPDFCHSNSPAGEEESPANAGINRTFVRDSSVVPLPQNDNIKPEFFEITKILEESEKLKKTLSRKNGFYFLAGREEIIAIRIQKKKLADKKLKSAGGRTKWILRFISYLPFVRFIALSGSIGIGNPDKKSDIDLLIIAKHGRIWTARAFLTFFALLFGAYRHSDKTENRLCLNHYITDKSLAIDFGNLYKAEEYLNLLPIAGDLDLYNKFVSSNAKWLGEYVFLDPENKIAASLRFMPQKNIYLAITRTLEYLLSGIAGNWLEKQAKKIQISYIKKNPLTNHPHSRIRYTDDNLVFHPILVETKIINKWKEVIAKFNA